MEIFPAIDIRNGNVVRLTEGDYNRMTVYGSSPLEMAETFIKKGAKNLHMVDLDGAKDGAPVNFDVIKSVAETGKLFTEVGGGIRDEKRIEDYLSLGVNRVILGTVAVRNFKFVEESVKKYGDKIAVGVDARDGKVAVSGWLETTEIDSLDFCRKLRDAGVKTVIYTDISKDGTLSGTNLKIYEKLSEIKGLDIIASGGITFEDEIKKLADMNTYGAIVGKAVYAGKLDLERVLKIAKGESV
ncbi:MAG: 1-(5-phosphoribosyl)-5-[(5-phosphoribosylamino)methylideneamino]imidazole-4-carboxamide isomerase [Ruminococcaceae bacterium]|nr:1-(5-phosphoribosyl)-5-[(5-phosphoribosylamino)methylideneamino]imidazole-4-carboxamide isomerase [Oscillospiraceae bacterium]